MDKRILVLSGGSGEVNEEFEFNDDLKDVVKHSCIYKTGKIYKYVRHISRVAPLSFMKWWREVNTYSTVIVFDSDFTKEGLNALIKKHKKGRTILYFRNTVNDRWEKWDLDSLQKKGLEIWSYCKSDCDRYGMHFNKHTLNRERVRRLQEMDGIMDYDVFFVGQNKNRNREPVLNMMADEFDKQGISYFYFVSHAPNLKNNHCENVEMLGYENEIKIICHSAAILDVSATYNETFNSRPIQAVFMKKKLITNFKGIKEYDVYNPKNIFIIGEDDISNLKNFIKSPYVDIEEKIVDSYDVNQWIQRFFI